MRFCRLLLLTEIGLLRVIALKSYSFRPKKKKKKELPRDFRFFFMPVFCVLSYCGVNDISCIYGVNAVSYVYDVNAVSCIYIWCKRRLVCL